MKFFKCQCKTCKWWEPFSAVCTNGDSEYRGDFVNGEWICPQFEPRIHEGCGGLIEGRVHNGKAVFYCYSCLLYVDRAWTPCARTELKGETEQ